MSHARMGVGFAVVCRIAVACVAHGAITTHLSGQAAKASALQDIGKTSVGTPVYLEPRSVTRANGIITAAVRVALSPPIKNGATLLKSSRTIAMYDCAKQTVATKETWYYTDAAYKTVGMHRAAKIPGFGPAFGGSLADVAMKYLCAQTP